MVKNVCQALNTILSQYIKNPLEMSAAFLQKPLEYIF